MAFEFAPECRQRRVEARFDGSFRHSHPVGNLGDRQLTPVAQCDRNALVFVEHVHGSAHDVTRQHCYQGVRNPEIDRLAYVADRLRPTLA
jgi:hypothetical protein